jgi:hypothetical protein
MEAGAYTSQGRIEDQTLKYLTFWSIFGAQGIVILIAFNLRIYIK